MFSPRKLGAKTIAALGGTLGGVWRYLEGGQEQVDYCLGADGTPTHAPVELHGRLVQRLGLTTLDRVGFERLAAGCHPETGARLVKTSHTTTLDPITGQAYAQGGQHVPGIDCNLSPPKSVSALLPFLSPEGRADLEQAHIAAVRATLDQIEQRVAMCRPTINGEQIHTPGELAIAVFTHHQPPHRRGLRRAGPPTGPAAAQPRVHLQPGVLPGPLSCRGLLPCQVGVLRLLSRS